MSSVTSFGIGPCGPITRFPDGTQWHPPSVSCADHNRALMFEMRTGDPGLFLTAAPPRIYVPDVFVQTTGRDAPWGDALWNEYAYIPHTGAEPFRYLDRDGDVLTARGTNRKAVYRLLHRSADGMWCAEWPD